MEPMGSLCKNVWTKVAYIKAGFPERSRRRESSKELLKQQFNVRPPLTRTHIMANVHPPFLLTERHK